MNLKFFTLLLINLFLLISINSLSAQIGINENGAAPATSAMLDVVSSDKGVLIPRLTQTQRDAIPSPATGLLIFQSDNTPGFYYYNGITWSFVGILPTAQAAITANTAKVSADGVVTTHSDVTDAGSGKIITDDERTKLAGIKELPTSPTIGTMTYWDGSAWVSITPGSDNQKLTFCDGQPIWTADGECPPEVGDFYQGGVIFHLFEEGETGYVAGETHGLIAAPMDQTDDNGIIWGCSGTDITAVPNVTAFPPSGNGSEIGDGATNTASIVDVANGGCSEAGAAKLCADLELNGFSDWFLPSILEFEKMVAEKDNINMAGGSTFNEADIHPTYGIYWSSTEFSLGIAYFYRFPFGLSSFGNKTVPLRVRAVRAF